VVTRSVPAKSIEGAAAIFWDRADLFAKGESQMSLETILIILLVVFLLGGGGWYYSRG